MTFELGLENNGIAIHHSLVHTIVLAALPTNGYDTEVRSLAACVETLSQHSDKVTTRGSYHHGQVPHLRITFVGEQCREKPWCELAKDLLLPRLGDMMI